jgi:hypothetical protein
VLLEKLASIREFDPSSAPLKKICPAPLFELANVKRDGRLAKMEDFGGSGEILQTSAFKKNFEPISVHLVGHCIVIHSPLATNLMSEVNVHQSTSKWTDLHDAPE